MDNAFHRTVKTEMLPTTSWNEKNHFRLSEIKKAIEGGAAYHSFKVRRYP